ncbi:MAG: ImmA/IrrE family metallo-endopeptidase [Candidatus Lokiarchaeota archaeon]|nr:ImmA/IrrE family metallo-endopeptidase [Candidatus Lokiarchaeota archaeon]
MISQRRKLARQALVKALQIRQAAKVKITDPICIYDFVERFGVEVRFESLPSMEGMYSKSPRPVIILNVERPSVRIFYNCGHEFGHHVFNHGYKIDELIENRKHKNNFYPDEFLVDCFSGFLLMPKIALQNAFKIRNWEPNSLNSLQLYSLACYFGVGYSTLITHLRHALGILDPIIAQELIKYQPNKIKRDIIGEIEGENLIIIDQHWQKRPVDIQVGDLSIAPLGTFQEGNCVSKVQTNNQWEVFKGIKQGVGRLVNPKIKWSAFVRVTKKNYVGLGKYRHFEEPNDE